MEQAGGSKSMHVVLAVITASWAALCLLAIGIGFLGDDPLWEWLLFAGVLGGTCALFEQIRRDALRNG